ncbi:hypothetical protein Tsubulata_035142 [Turnera subulata]|uniref:Phosphoglycerate kinase n=1 Tax=Turnera subulata TaxID=218843 RepID=A0A9Q0FZZ3_9ROSI|nr:hypothetical protein Tsubulata_035142 [Turnera subulata]
MVRQASLLNPVPQLLLPTKHLTTLYGGGYTSSSPPCKPCSSSLLLLDATHSPSFLCSSCSGGGAALQSSSPGGLKTVDNNAKNSIEYKAYRFDEEESELFPHIQTLRNFPKEEIVGRVVMVRFDSNILLREELNKSCHSVSNAIHTITYLLEAGAKLVLVSDWKKTTTSKLLDAETIAGFLSSIIGYQVVAVQCKSSDASSKIEVLKSVDIVLLENLSEFKEEVANSSKFAELLSSGVDIFVSDSFSCSHKVLASTVGVARFCSACLAGFHFEESLRQLKEVAETDKKPYVAIIGGGSFCDKKAALHFLASRCDGMIFIGMMAFQIMHALEHSLPSVLLEPGAQKEALNIIKFARQRNIFILYPKDFWCINDEFPGRVDLVPAHAISAGWLPVDLGPSSLDEINSVLTKCKKILWIGPAKLKFANQYTDGTSNLVRMLDEASKKECDITVVGSMACKAISLDSSPISSYDGIESASVVWGFFNGRKLPGIMALDRAYPFVIDWSLAYHNPALPLVVDIGSGNGMFLLEMARRRKDLNFLGLEINKKLVRRCLDFVQQNGLQNGYFIATNATSTFRTIISSYPGKLVLVSIQCPNPDFTDPENRWRMLQRSLVEAVADLLAHEGKVFLQSDVEVVAERMRELFLKYGKGKLTLLNDQPNTKRYEGVWLEENPFGVRSDWEQHVIDRGGSMYRLLLSKPPIVECSEWFRERNL